MKKIVTALFVMIFCAAGSAWAQTETAQPENMEKVKALYVAFVTRELDLTPDEAQKFWPVHGQFENELRGVNRDLPELEREQLVLNIKKRFQGNFTGILGAKRCERFFRAHVKFKQKLVERFQNRKAQQQPNNANRPQRGNRQ